MKMILKRVITAVTTMSLFLYRLTAATWRGRIVGPGRFNAPVYQKFKG